MRLIKYRYLGVNPGKKIELYKKLVLDSHFNLAVNKIREELEISGDADDLSMEEFIHLIESSAVSEKVKALVKEFNLPKTWSDIIHRYVVEGDFTSEIDPDGLMLEISQKDEGSEKEYFLRISPSTSIEDIKNVWFLIQKEIGSRKKTKKKINKKFDRDQRVYKLYLARNSTEKIAEAVKKEFGEDLDYGNIKVIISNQKKLTKGKK